MQFFTAMLMLRSITKLPALLSRIRIDVNNLEDNLTAAYNNLSTTPAQVTGFGVDLVEILAIAKGLAIQKKKLEDNLKLEKVEENELCIGVPQFFLACGIHRDNVVMQTLAQQGFSLLVQMQEAVNIVKV